MKQITTFLLVTAIVFLNSAVISQTGNNPFNVKQKTDLKTTHQQPSAALLEISAQSSSNLPATNYNFKSIAFKYPSSIQKENFSSIKYDKNGLINFVESKDGKGILFSGKSNSAIEEAAIIYLENIASAMRIKNTAEEFKSLNFQTDDLNYAHIKLQQYYKGVKVYGGQVILHALNNEIKVFNGTYFPSPNIENVKPEINKESASTISWDNISTKTQITDVNSFGIKELEYEKTISELVIWHNDRDLNSEKLAWHLTLRPNFLERWEYFVDANSGEILDSYSSTCTDGPATANAVDLNGVTRNINTYLSGGMYYMLNASKPMFNSGQSNIPDNPVGAIMTLNANNTNNSNITYVQSGSNSWNDASSVSAHYNASLTYDYYYNTHSRNSINGSGGTIYSIVNVADENGQSMANAYWNGQAMFYGNGGGVFLPLAGGIDVAAHEMTHGVVQNTANLEYKNEPGAINEAMADIAGSMVDRSNWQIGEAVIPAGSPNFPSGALRDMQDPHNGGSGLGDNGWQPKHTNEQYHGSEDHGGVHTNSGIINHAYYLLAETVSKNKAEQIYYRALANYMTKSSQFIDCRLAFEQAAKDLYGNGSNEANAVSNSFYSVGIGDSGSGGGGGGSEPPGEIQVNPGQDYILSYDVNSLDANTLYVSSTTGTNFVAISQSELKRKPSLVDNGSVGVMITEADQMETIEMTSPYNESVISSETIWDNAAVAKDGSRIAAITTSIDSAIYVWSYAKQQWAKFHLYSPTFTEGVYMDNVLYADALEWDYTGQYLVYDAYNELQNSSGQNIDYWDVGFIKVWDNATNNWGNGEIFKLFSGLPENVSIGNPSLSKNTPFILAFDYFDQNTGETKIMGANLETGDVNTIFNNSILGFPNYSKLDDKLVFSAKDNTSTEVVGIIPLAVDKISPAGDAGVLINVAKWPVWYATGNRNLLSVEENDDYKVLSSIYPNPVADVLNVALNTENAMDYRTDIYNIYGQKIMEVENVSSVGLTKQTLDVSTLAKGTYFVRISVGKNSFTHKFIK